MKRKLVITLIILSFCTALNAQSEWTDWVKLKTGEVYCRIQKVIPSIRYGSSYYDINIQYKVKNQWLKTISDATSSIEAANAYFIDNGIPNKAIPIYINKLRDQEYFYFEGKMEALGSATRYFEARFVVHTYMKNDTYCSYKIPL